MGWGISSQIFKGKYEAKLEFSRGVGVGEGYGHFLEQHYFDKIEMH